MFVNTFSASLQENLSQAKKRLPSEDILSYVFQTADGVNCALLYADGMVNKQLLGELISRPLTLLSLHKNQEKQGGMYAFNLLVLSDQSSLYKALRATQPRWKNYP